MDHCCPWDTHLRAFRGLSKEDRKSSNSPLVASFPGFAEEEEATLRQLPRVELLPPDGMHGLFSRIHVRRKFPPLKVYDILGALRDRICLSAALSAADILFGAAYEERFSQGSFKLP
eukprot:scaffold149_cov315-Pinguiococcus_pyrenoidosus.AAC.87